MLSSTCSFVVALVPELVDASIDTYTNGAWGRINRTALSATLAASSLGDTVPALLRQASRRSFNGRPGAPSFAYAVVARTGLVNRYPACLPFFWHGVWAVSQWAAQQHGIVPDPASVVLRTRPDVLLTRPMDIRGLLAYFAFGRHGRHMALAQSVFRANGGNVAQNDIHAVFSYGAYETDVARPLERSADSSLAPPVARLWWQRGWASGWAMGRTDDPWTQMGRRYFEVNTTRRDDKYAPFVRALVERCMDRCLCLDGRPSCASPSCLLVVAESVVVKTDACAGLRSGATYGWPRPSCVLRAPLPSTSVDEAFGASVLPSMLGPPIDLTARVTCYCASASTSLEAAAQHGLSCPVKPLSRCHPRQLNDTVSRAAGHYRCPHAARLLPEVMEAASARAVASAGWLVGVSGRWPNASAPQSDGGGEEKTTRQRISEADGFGVWPPGCGGSHSDSYEAVALEHECASP